VDGELTALPRSSLSLSKGKGREMGECLTSARVIKALHWYA